MSIHDTLYRSPTQSSIHAKSVESVTPSRHKLLYRTAATTSTSSSPRNRSVASTSSATVTPPAASAARRHVPLPATCPVKIVFRVTDDASLVEREDLESNILFYSTAREGSAAAAEDDADVSSAMGPATAASASTSAHTVVRLHSDHTFLPSDSPSLYADTLVSRIAEDAFRGVDSVVALMGEPGVDKHDVLIHPEVGLIKRYAMAMLSELEMNHLSQLWCLRCCVLNHVGEHLEDCSSSELGFDVRASGTRHRHDAANRHNSSLAEFVDRYSRVVTTVDEMEDIIDQLQITYSKIPLQTMHRIIVLSVVPAIRTQPLASSSPAPSKGIAQLMKPLGSLIIVDVVAGSASDSWVKDSAAASRHAVRTLVSVLCAVTRRWHAVPADGSAPAKAVYVPYRDDSLTLALEHTIEKGATVYACLNVHGRCVRPSQSELLQSAEMLTATRFPQGRPAVDYALLARREHQRVVALRHELAVSRLQWEEEKRKLENDRLMLRKAYDSANAPESFLTDANIGTNKIMSVQDTLHMTKLMLSTCQREKMELEKALHKYQAGSPGGGSPKERWATSTRAVKPAGIDSTAPIVELLTSAKIIDLPERGAGTTSALSAAALALCQLTSQLCDREEILWDIARDPGTRSCLLKPQVWEQVAAQVAKCVAAAKGASSPVRSTTRGAASLSDMVHCPKHRLVQNFQPSPYVGDEWQRDTAPRRGSAEVGRVNTPTRLVQPRTVNSSTSGADPVPISTGSPEPTPKVARQRSSTMIA